jgi:hypothetical protein
MGPMLLVAMLVALAPSSARAQVAALISRNGGQQPADSHSYRPSLSADGRFVAFESWAGNLAPGVDVTNNGVFVRDLIAGTTVLASPGTGAPPDGKSYMAAIRGDGRVIAFWSRASNLIPGDTNGEEDLFTYDRVSAVVTRANVSTAGTPAEPADGGRVEGARSADRGDDEAVDPEGRRPRRARGRRPDRRGVARRRGEQRLAHDEAAEASRDRREGARRPRRFVPEGNRAEAREGSRHPAEAAEDRPAGVSRRPQSRPKKSFPLSSTTMKAGKSSTSIFQIASIPSSGYSSTSIFRMLSRARIAAGPPIEPR